MIRVLVTLWPLMYREVIALSVQHGRPGLVEVRIALPEEQEREFTSFRPHLLVHNYAGPGGVLLPEAAIEAVPNRLEVLYSDSVNVHLGADRGPTELRNASTDDLLGAVDAVASLAQREVSVRRPHRRAPR